MNFLKSLALWSFHGILGGWLCGSVIFSFLTFLDPQEKVGIWSMIGCLGLGFFYGGMIGYLMFFFLRIVFFKIKDDFLLHNRWRWASITIAGGCIGGVGGEVLMSFLGTMLFFFGAFIYFLFKN